MTGYLRARVEAVLTQRSIHATRLFKRHHPDPIGTVPSPSRFCDGSSFAVLYGATDFDTAFLEVVVRDRFVRKPDRRVPFSELQTRRWVTFISQGKELNLINLTFDRAIKLGAPTDAAKARSHSAGRALAKSIYADHPDVDGFLYESRLTGMECFAIFDRAVAKLRVWEVGEVTTHSLLPSVLTMHDITLVRTRPSLTS